MSRKAWVEVVCDSCGCADHFPPGNVSQQMRDNGWIVSKIGDFCDEKCLDKAKNKPLTNPPSKE